MTTAARAQRTKKLTGRERLNRMFDRQDHDSVPRYDSYWPETIEKWTEQTGGEIDHPDKALDALDADMQAVQGPWLSPFAGHHEKIGEDEDTTTYIDEWGGTVRYFKGKSGTPEHIDFGCKERDDWESRYKPALEKAEITCDPDKTRADFKHVTEDRQRWPYLTGLEAVEATRRMMGDEITMISLAEDPEWVAEVSRVYTDAVLRGYERILATGIQPDGIWMYGDMAYNHATMCSPAMYKDVFWPDHKRLADWAHAHGMKFIYHTDGNVNGVIDLYVEAGFDCLQPLEAKAEMDVRNLAPAVGDRLALFGNIDVMLMGANDLEKIEADLTSKLDAGMKTRGYAYHSDHSVPPLVDWSTYRFIIDLLDRHGNYE